MNVRIENQNIRFKITQDELFTLLKGDCIHIELDLMGKNLIALINPKGLNEVMEVKLITDENDIYISLLVPPAKIKELSNMGRSRDGLQQEMGGLFITIQVDFRTNKTHKKAS